MKSIKLALAAFVPVLAGLWLLADTLLPSPLTYFSFRTAFVQLTGIIAIGAMSAAMVLAVRPRWLEPHLDGLDKMYRLHKWLGIVGLIAAIIHWWWAQGTKWMVNWGWLTRPARGAGSPPAFGPIESLLRSQRGLAEDLGEWAFYAAVVLIALALWKRFPYHLFAKTHRWIAAVYLVLAYHALALAKFAYWSQPIGWLLALLLLVGAISALVALSGRIGADRKVGGAIESLTHYPELKVLETSIRLQEGWAGHRAGQFAFATSRKEEGAHPYTIASAWDPEQRRIVLITKALGDHTSKLSERLRVGQPVTVEGPYGCFDFDDDHPRQIWIGAGIGITPFIARMKLLANRPGVQKIDLFHPTADFSADAINKLTDDAQAAEVRLHVLVSPRDGQLSAERIRAAVPDWSSASIWFCGPPRFGQALRDDFVAHGLPAANFRQELFQMR
ncbi:Ferric reductase [Hyphomicrobiales bacterium]|nr:Ferric reductase [Hyphomicrobiales bacterium]CAH1699859.1 Ferric reductase [Hyphomicrobiales bacterium]CAI0343588.1 Ferric reductase [Hyphomicrobiales bacterium]